MSRESERVKAAQAKATDYMETIFRVIEGPNFVEISGEIGGDVVTYRFYDAGYVTQR